MEAYIAVAKTGKYATSESGDTVEMVERPAGGISLVLVDGQRSGKAAKVISNLVARKALSLLAEGVRDGAAARAASDYLFTSRSGQVMATLNIVSIDLLSSTMVITRNNSAPVFVIEDEKLTQLNDAVDPVGIRRGIRPQITEISLSLGLTTICYTDGIGFAGDRYGQRFEVENYLNKLMDRENASPQDWADGLLEEALRLDKGRPSDDMSVVVASILPKGKDDIRRLTARMPLK
jgi:serine phosphatase RsbU (regulator of sigma subunit)